MSDAKDFYEAYWEWREENFDYRTQGIKPRRHVIALKLMKVVSGKLAPKGSERTSVLDIGCGDGILGQMLQESDWASNFYTVGVDISERAVEMSRPYYTEAIVGDVTKTSLSLPRDQFDFVVSLETIEHVTSPRRMLQVCRELLAVDGHLLLSTPNFAEYRNRFQVIKGRFPTEGCVYNPREHIHHFTFYSCAALIRDSGFRLEAYDGTFRVPKILKRIFGTRRSKSLFRRWPNLFGSQLIFLASKIGSSLAPANPTFSVPIAPDEINTY